MATLSDERNFMQRLNKNTGENSKQVPLESIVNVLSLCYVNSVSLEIH